MDPVEPDWLARSRETFEERLRMLVLSWVATTGRIPVVLMIEDAEGTRAARCSEDHVRRSLPGPETLEEARHALAAWRAWAPLLDPRTAGVFISVDDEPEARVVLARLTEQSRRMFADRAPQILESLRQGGFDVEPIPAAPGRQES